MLGITNRFSTGLVLQDKTVDRGLGSKTKEATPIQPSGAADSQASATAQISVFSRTLSDVADRAAARDASTNRSGLAAIAQSCLDRFTGPDYTRNRAAHDAELPKSSDPQRLALARQATDFLHDKAINPFRSMSRDQLALITYDDSGAFTINERRAAWWEARDRTAVWGEALVEKIMDEHHRTGKMSTAINLEMLRYYTSLPAIEEAQLPNGYEAWLLARIMCPDSADSPPHEIEFDFLIEILERRREQAKLKLTMETEDLRRDKASSGAAGAVSVSS